MYLQDLFPALKIRKFNGYTSVKTSRSCQRRIKRFRSVGCCQDDDTVISFKTIHLCQKLVQGLLSFIIAAHTSITLLANGINLINKHDTGRLFLGLIKQIPYLGCSHTDKHLNKLRTGNREKWNACFSCYCLGKHGLTGSGRAYKQDTLGHGGSDLLILLRIMKIFYNLCQIFLGFILSCHIMELNSL